MYSFNLKDNKKELEVKEKLLKLEAKKKELDVEEKLLKLGMRYHRDCIKVLLSKIEEDYDLDNL